MVRISKAYLTGGGVVDSIVSRAESEQLQTNALTSSSPPQLSLCPAGMRIYQLDASSRDACTNETVIHNEHAYMLTQWLEYGVFEAIERKWVRS